MAARLVALDLAGGPSFVAALRRAWDDGDAVLPLDPRLASPARAALLERLRPAAVVCDDGVRALPGAVPVLPGDAVVIATSGTTGGAKGVVLTRDALEASARITSDSLGVDPARDRWYACLPMAHIGGLSVLTRSLLTGTACTVVATPDPDGLAAASRGGHTLVSLVVAVLGRVDSAAWRTILLGGSSMPAGLAANVVRTYGMTETGSGIVYDGYPLAGVALRIVDGEIEVRTPTLARAYRGDPTAGEVTPQGAALVGPHGWYGTGDAGSLADDGQLQVRGRVGDVIVTGGEKVWPEPLERVLAGVSGVREVAVLGLPDPRWGQAVTAVVVTDGPVSLDACRDAVKASLAAYCAPTRLVVVKEIPRTAIGKVRRDALREALLRDEGVSGTQAG